MSQPITPFLWFATQAEEAMDFYLSIFPNSRKIDEIRYGPAGPGPVGDIMVVNFDLNGQRFTALNGNQQFPFTKATSFVVQCSDQAEIDHYWTALTAGGKEVACGWLEDKFGISWQITPINIKELIATPAAMRAMMSMVKLDIAALKAASHS